MTRTIRSRLKGGVALAAIFAQIAVTAGPASAFCGFYVAQADAKLFNKSSKVVLTRDGRQTAITMASDYQGEPSEFALVIPVPTFIERNQISVVSGETIDHLDSYTAPRLVEYFDEIPCQRLSRDILAYRSGVAAASAIPTPVPQGAPSGVTVEARYDVGEYDISILSAEQSDGLIRWLTDNGYKIPSGAEPVIDSYIKQKMHFFVAKVNVKRMNELKQAYLRPLQVRYETAKFMLPLRLGTVNANGPQDLIVYALSRKGRVEATNYRTVKVPSDINVPLFVKDDFPNFYKAAFDRAVDRENRQGVFVEYAWNMAWCDPCAAQPMSGQEMKELGAQWVDNPTDIGNRWQSGGVDSFVTRLHVRYDAKTFPEDLNFVETADRENFQARYVLHHPFVGDTSCQAGKDYRAELPKRFRQEAQNLANTTGWSQNDIEVRMEMAGQPLHQPR